MVYIVHTLQFGYVLLAGMFLVVAKGFWGQTLDSAVHIVCSFWSE